MRTSGGKDLESRTKGVQVVNVAMVHDLELTTLDNYRIISKNKFQSLQNFSVLFDFNHTTLIVPIKVPEII